MAKKESFILYTDQKAVIDKLSDEQAGKLIKAIYEYVEDGKMPELDSVLDLVITPFKTVLDKDRTKYEEVSKARAEAGSKGGRAKENKTKQKKQLQAKENKTSNSDDNDNEYDNDNVNDNDLNIKSKRKTFTPPTLEEVKNYVKEKKLNVDADYFHKYFSEGSWIDSLGKPVKNWKQKLITWDKRNKESVQKPEEIPKQEYKEVDTSQLTPEEYGELVRGKVTIQELIKRGKVHVR